MSLFDVWDAWCALWKQKGRGARRFSNIGNWLLGDQCRELFLVVTEPLTIAADHSKIFPPQLSNVFEVRK
jgi:hypothetical protein